MHDQDLDEWCELMSGRETEAPPHVRKETTLLRDAVLRQIDEVAQKEASPEHREAQLDSLLAEATKRGLLAEKPRSLSERLLQGLERSLPRFPRWVPVAATAAIVVVVGVMVTTNVPERPEVELERSASQLGGPIESANPEKAATELAIALRGLGLKPSVEQDDGLWIVEVLLPMPTPPEIQAFLAKRHLTAQADGLLRATFVAAATSSRRSP